MKGINMKKLFITSACILGLLTAQSHFVSANDGETSLISEVVPSLYSKDVQANARYYNEIFPDAGEVITGLVNFKLTNARYGDKFKVLLSYNLDPNGVYNERFPEYKAVDKMTGQNVATGYYDKNSHSIIFTTNYYASTVKNFDNVEIEFPMFVDEEIVKNSINQEWFDISLNGIEARTPFSVTYNRAEIMTYDENLDIVSQSLVQRNYNILSKITDVRSTGQFTYVTQVNPEGLLIGGNASQDQSTLKLSISNPQFSSNFYYSDIRIYRTSKIGSLPHSLNSDYEAMEDVTNLVGIKRQYNSIDIDLGVKETQDAYVVVVNGRFNRYLLTSSTFDMESKLYKSTSLGEVEQTAVAHVRNMR